MATRGHHETATPDIRRCRWRGFFEVRLNIHYADTWIGTTTEPPALCLGIRWAKWKARRMLAAHLREHQPA